MESTREIHPELQAVFDEHAAPTHASKRDIHAQLLAVLKVALAAQRQIAEYRSLLTIAKVADHDPELDFKMHHMIGTFASAERNSAASTHFLTLLADDFSQLDRYAAEWLDDIARWKAVGSQRVVLPAGAPPLAPDARLYETAPPDPTEAQP